MKKIIGLVLTVFISNILFGCSVATNSGDIHAEISPIKDDRKAIVTIVSDDGDYETGVILNELANEYDLRVTVAGIVEWIKPHLKEWKQIEAEGNVELISHSYSHQKMAEDCNLGENQLRHQIVDAKTFFESNFITDQIAFVPPENTMCELGYKILNDNGVYAIRQGQRGENGLDMLKYAIPTQWFSLAIHGIGDVTTTTERNGWVNGAVKNGTWLIEMWHNVSAEGNDGYQGLSTEAAREHMEYISSMQKQNEIWAASFVDATKYLYEKDNAVVKAVLNGDSISVELKYKNDELPEHIFNYPLTVKIPMPLEWGNKDISAKSNQNISITNNNNVKYILVNMVPNTEKVTVYAK